MAKRYCGEVTIELYYRDDKPDPDYRARVSCTRGYRVIVVKPPGVGYGDGVAYDSPEAYDRAAHAALSFAMDDCGNGRLVDKSRYIADAAALGLADGNYQILRKRGRMVSS